METNLVTASVLDEEISHKSERPAIERTMEGEEIPFSEVEKHYKKPGGTLLHALLGADPFDFWVGRFYVGAFGILSLIGIFFGVAFYFYQVWVVEKTFNLLQARIDPPPISAGLRIVAPNEPGFFWQMIVFFATIAFIGWLMRQVDITRKLGMSYEIPIAYGAVVSSWITIQWLRPIAMGAWGNGFALGITHHLDWVSNIGYQYYNFFFNPFHAIGISLLFFSTLVLAMHGSAILSAARDPNVREGNVDGFWRNILGYSIGEIGIHRAGFWIAVASVLFSNLCIFLSGTLIYDWYAFWGFVDQMPILESGIGLSVVAAAITAAVVYRGRKTKTVDLKELEYGGRGITGTALRKPQNLELFDRLFGIGQVGPVYLGIAGTVAVAAGALTSFIILEHYLWLVNYDVLSLLRNFLALSLDPPNFAYGLGLGPSWHDGTAWVFATMLLHVSVIAWWVRVYARARAAGLRPYLAYGFACALFLYFIIYLVRPLLIGNWAQAPGHGASALLLWTNNVSIQFGNFYYNPFHMLSIFFLLGSTLLLAMHGATIVATSAYGSHREIEEMMVEGTGTHRAQLFWRWTMGFNVNSKTIHDWAWWFAGLTAITGGIGLLLSGTVILNWFEWAQLVGIVAPLP